MWLYLQFIYVKTDVLKIFNHRVFSIYITLFELIPQIHCYYIIFATYQKVIQKLLLKVIEKIFEQLLVTYTFLQSWWHKNKIWIKRSLCTKSCTFPWKFRHSFIKVNPFLIKEFKKFGTYQIKPVDCKSIAH